MELTNNALNTFIGGKTRLYGLIGNPIAHTISPLIHNSLAKELNIDMVYVPISIEEEQLENAIKGLKAIGFGGYNVTVPYKEKVIKYLDELDDSAKKFEAVNTVKIIDGKLIGYNTDAFGFYRSFVETFQCKIDGQKILIIGAGGAASSIASVMADKGAFGITVANRTVENAKKVCERITSLPKERIRAIELNDNINIEEYDVLINTTSVGMHPNINSTVLKNSTFNSNQKVVDIIYNPIETDFLRRARVNGAKTLNGFGMLYYQAVYSFELWNSMGLPQNIEKKIYEIISSNLGEIIK